MKVPFKNISLWFIPWQTCIYLDGYFEKGSRITGPGYTFDVKPEDNWAHVSAEHEILLQPVSESKILYRGKPIENLYSLFKLKDGKVQINYHYDSKDGVAITIASIDDLEVEGPVFTLDGDEINEPF